MREGTHPFEWGLEVHSAEERQHRESYEELRWDWMAEIPLHHRRSNETHIWTIDESVMKEQNIPSQNNIPYAMLQYCKWNHVTRIVDTQGHCAVAERTYDLTVAHSKKVFMLRSS